MGTRLLHVLKSGVSCFIDDYKRFCFWIPITWVDECTLSTKGTKWSFWTKQLLSSLHIHPLNLNSVAQFLLYHNQHMWVTCFSCCLAKKYMLLFYAISFIVINYFNSQEFLIFLQLHYKGDKYALDFTWEKVLKTRK